MTKEIKRNAWSRFCKKFSIDNQHRLTNISFKASTEDKFIAGMPFIGMALEKKGRFIDGIRIQTLAQNHDDFTGPSVSIKDPQNILIEKDNDGRDKFLVIESKEGHSARLEMTGDNDKESNVRQFAYSLFEKRGYENGNDCNDWFEAERIITEKENQFVG